MNTKHFQMCYTRALGVYARIYGEHPDRLYIEERKDDYIIFSAYKPNSYELVKIKIYKKGEEDVC